MDFSTLKKLTIGGIELKQLFIDGIQVWKSGSKNWVRYSTEVDDVTIYNGGKGYKDGTRLRSGGAEGDCPPSTHTGYIKVSPGDIIRIGGGWFGNGYNNGSAINVSDGGHSNIGQFSMIGSDYGIFLSSYSQYGFKSVVQESTNVWRWTVPPASAGVAYIRVTCNTYSSASVNGAADGSKLIVTINEEIT